MAFFIIFIITTIGKFRIQSCIVGISRVDFNHPIAHLFVNMRCTPYKFFFIIVIFYFTNFYSKVCYLIQIDFCFVIIGSVERNYTTTIKTIHRWNYIITSIIIIQPIKIIT